MNVKTRKRALVGVGAATALALVLAPATAAMAAPLSNGSEFPIYLLDTDSEAPIPNDAVLAWEGFATLAADEAVPYTRFPASPDATGVKYFISAPGQEYTQAQWYGTKGGAINAEFTNGLSYVPLDTFGDGDRAGDVSDVKTNGGTYSLGFVYTKENGNIIANGKGAWVTIQVTAGTGAWTFTEPGVTITQQPAAQTVDEGDDATFTAAATGSETVKWQSSPTGTDPWTDVAGASAATLTVADAAADDAGFYRAVFTNRLITSTTSAAQLTVDSGPVITQPVEPTDAANAATKKDVANPAANVTTVAIDAGTANASKQLDAWIWKDGVRTGPQAVTSNASGVASVELPGAGTYTVGLTERGVTTPIIAWDNQVVITVDGPDHADGSPATVPLSARVTASDLWALQGVASSIDFGTVQRGQAVAREMNGIKVIDDRNELKGWRLSATWNEFTAPEGSIPASALAFALAPGAGTTLIDGITVATGGPGAVFAESDKVTTLEAGQLFDADLTFTAPDGAKPGAYNSTMTLTLISK